MRRSRSSLRGANGSHAMTGSATKQATLSPLLRHGLLRGAYHRAALWADPLARNVGETEIHLRDLAARSARGLA
jgi:hypothetical protein